MEVNLNRDSVFRGVITFDFTICLVFFSFFLLIFLMLFSFVIFVEKSWPCQLISTRD